MLDRCLKRDPIGDHLSAACMRESGHSGPCSFAALLDARTTPGPMRRSDVPTLGAWIASLDRDQFLMFTDWVMAVDDVWADADDKPPPSARVDAALEAFAATLEGA